MRGALTRGRLALVERLSPRQPALDGMAMLGAMPVATLLLDAVNRFRYANQAAEQFLGMSLQQLENTTLASLLPADNPIFALLEAVRAHGTTIADHDLTLESPRLHKRGIMVQATALTEEPGQCAVDHAG